MHLFRPFNNISIYLFFEKGKQVVKMILKNNYVKQFLCGISFLTEYSING